MVSEDFNGKRHDSAEVLEDSEPTTKHESTRSTRFAPSESETTSGEDNSYDHDHEVKREPFLSFIPKLARYGHRVVTGEAKTVKNAVVGCPSWSKNYSVETYQYYRANPRVLFDEIMSGFTVAIMQVPESIAFSFVAGVSPLSGLHATFWMATITGLFGGKPGMISGAAGALAVVVVDLTVDDGVLSYLNITQRLNVLYMTMFVCGIFQILFAIFRLSKLVRLIPETGMIGFMDGLAIIIFMAQLPAFQYCDSEPLFIMCTVEERQWLTFQNNAGELCLVLLHVAFCMLIMRFFPKVPKLKIGRFKLNVAKLIPASLVALLLGTLFEHTLFRKAIGIGTRTVEETAPMKGTPPRFDWPEIPNDSNTISTMFTYAITLAAIGSVESVLTLQACNEITDTVPKVRDANQELFAQGLGNLVCGMFRAMGGDAMIGQSTINIMNGARHRVSSTMSGIFMLLFVVILSPFIDLMPVATLTGVLFMVVLSTFQWKTFKILRYGRLSDSITILLVTLIAVFFNLAIAIAVGIVWSALIHAWDSGSHVDADIVYKPMIVNGDRCEVKYVHVRGTLFFSSTRKFINMFSVKDDPPTIILDFKDALIADHSGVAAIQGISHRFAKVGKRVLITNLQQKSHGRLHRTGDHSVLRRQITHHSCLSDLEDDEENQEPKKAAAEVSIEVNITPSSTPTDSQVDEPVDEYRVGETLNHLTMFDNPVEPVDDEIEELLQDQAVVSIHSIRDNAM